LADGTARFVAELVAADMAGEPVEASEHADLGIAAWPFPSLVSGLVTGLVTGLVLEHDAVLWRGGTLVYASDGLEAGAPAAPYFAEKAHPKLAGTSDADPEPVPVLEFEALTEVSFAARQLDLDDICSAGR